MISIGNMGIALLRFLGVVGVHNKGGVKIKKVNSGNSGDRLWFVEERFFDEVMREDGEGDGGEKCKAESKEHALLVPPEMYDDLDDREMDEEKGIGDVGLSPESE